MKFGGEYKNGKRNGKGIEYAYGRRLVFEGEYKNGNRFNGKWYYDGELELGYEMKDGNGKGKEFDDYERLIFDGEYRNGKKMEGGKNFITVEI